MSEPFLGMIMIVPYNFAPRGWAFCSGQILPIAQNTALFSLLGTTFGGNGQTTFALPDMRGRAALSSGQGPGLSSYDLGQVGGTESVTLTINQMPQHFHTVAPQASANAPTASKANGNIPAGGDFYDVPPGGVALAPSNSSLVGGSQPFQNLNPYLVLNYCIALEGIFPSRN
jgi:microcystin-dependent protein